MMKKITLRFRLKIQQNNSNNKQIRKRIKKVKKNIKAITMIKINQEIKNIIIKIKDHDQHLKTLEAQKIPDQRGKRKKDGDLVNVQDLDPDQNLRKKKK